MQVTGVEYGYLTVFFKHVVVAYAAVIQKLEGELGLKKYYFPEIKDRAADFLDEHQDDPDIRNMSVEEIEEIMRQSDSEFGDEEKSDVF